MSRHFDVLSQLLPLVLLVGTCSVLSADSIPAGSIVFTNQALPLTGSGSINQFNTSLGTLTSIEIIVTGASMSGTVTDQYTGGTAQPRQRNVQVTMGGDLYVLDPSDSTNALSDTTMSATVTGQTLLNDGTVNTFLGLSTTGNQSDTFNLDTDVDFTPFEGTGTLALPYSVSAGTAFSTSTGNPLTLDNPSTATVSGLTGANVEVIYQFNDSLVLPEPASLGFVGGGLLLAGCFARRRQKKS